MLTAIISIGMIKVLTGYLDIEGYGLYSKIYNYLSIFAVIADLGLYTITVRELSAHQDDEKMVDKIASNVLTLRTLSGACIIIFSLGIGYFLDGYNSPEAMIGIGITSLFTLLGLVNSSLMSYLQSILRTEFSIIANTSGKLLTFGMILMFAGLLGGLVHTEKFVLVMLAGLAGNLLMTALTWWYANRWHRVHFGWDIAYIQHILLISLPYGLALFLNVIFFKVDTILLSIMEPREIADSVIALYALPMKIVEVGMMYGTVFLNSLLPVLTDSIEKKDEKKTRSLTSHAFSLLLFFGIGISTFLYLARTEVTRIISTSAFVTTTLHGYVSTDAMAIVVWIFLVYFVSSLATYILIAHGRQRSMMYVNAVIALVNIIGNILIIPHYSFVGSAVVTLITQVLLLIATMWLVRRDFVWKSIIQKVFIIGSIATVSGIISWFVGNIFFVFSSPTFIESIWRIILIGGIYGLIYVGGFMGVRKMMK